MSCRTATSSTSSSMSKIRIDHAAVYVSDLTGARDFFVRYLGARSNDGYHNERTGFRSFFLTFDGGCRLELMNRPELSAEAGEPYHVGYAHIAFSLGSKERVDQLTARLSADGYAVTGGPRTTGDGYYESCVAVFDGILIELTV